METLANEAVALGGVFHAIKYDHLYLLNNAHGMIPAGNAEGLGFYYLDTRFISAFELEINEKQPITLLSSAETSSFSTAVYTNHQTECEHSDGSGSVVVTIPKETFVLKRETVLNEIWFERLQLINYSNRQVTIKLSFTIEADFKDLFNVRAFSAQTEGKPIGQRFENNELLFQYRDGTDCLLESRLRFRGFEPTLEWQKDMRCCLSYKVQLASQEEKTLFLDIIPQVKQGRRSESVPLDFQQAKQAVQVALNSWSADTTGIKTDNEAFNTILTRAHHDIRMLETSYAENDQAYHFIAAGIPWYVALFGRDSLITARNMLLVKPQLSKDTLAILAHFQGKEHNPWRDEEPGKMLHEMRVGELARHGKIPHTPYYGSVDATPLWLILLHDYVLWSQDTVFLKDIWPHALAAMDWIDTNLANSKLPYLNYATSSQEGLRHQGWKDSSDSAMYADGVQASPPLYLVEVQGYAYHAKKAMAAMANVLGDKDLALRLDGEAQQFKQRFNKDFWSAEMQYASLALDKEGKPLNVVASNPGHCLESGLFDPEKARQLAKRLMRPDMFNGWGIRTLSSGAICYNPMSYHNGSIWPHDNAMIAKGLVAVGEQEAALKLFDTMYNVARVSDYGRLPELFCGFEKDWSTNDPPVRYPVACSPQAWAASSLYYMLQSLLNMQPIYNPEQEQTNLLIKKPLLPLGLQWLKLRKLRIGKAQIDLDFYHSDGSVMVNVVKKSGPIQVYIEL